MIHFQFERGNPILFFFEPGPLVSGRALLMMSPALKAREMRKSWISCRLGLDMMVDGLVLQ